MPYNSNNFKDIAKNIDFVKNGSVLKKKLFFLRFFYVKKLFT